MNDLWTETLRHLEEGNFTSLQEHLGGPEGFDRQIAEWHKDGRFDRVPDLLAEALSCACMLGLTDTARYLLDNGVDPYAGMKTGLSGPHYAVSGGHVDTIKMLLKRNIPLEVKNIYGGTLLYQALWSIDNEHKPVHLEIIRLLLDAGAEVVSGTAEWWKDQTVTSESVKREVLDLLNGVREDS